MKRHLLRVVFSGVVAFGALTVVASWQFGSLSNASLYLQGHNVAVPPSVALDVDAEGVAPVSVRNLGFTDIRIVGAQTTCSCLVLDGLPITLSPRERATLKVQMFPTGDGDTRQVARLMFDNDGRLEEYAVAVVGRSGLSPTSSP